MLTQARLALVTAEEAEGAVANAQRRLAKAQARLEAANRDRAVAERELGTLYGRRKVEAAWLVAAAQEGANPARIRAALVELRAQRPTVG